MLQEWFDCRSVSTARATAESQPQRGDELTAQFYYVIKGVDKWSVSRADEF
jgi:hypothetical protein